MTHLIVTEQPDAGCLIVLIVRDHNVVLSYLEQVVLRDLHLAIATPHPRHEPTSQPVHMKGALTQL